MSSYIILKKKRKRKIEYKKKKKTKNLVKYYLYFQVFLNQPPFRSLSQSLPTVIFPYHETQHCICSFLRKLGTFYLVFYLCNDDPCQNTSNLKTWIMSYFSWFLLAVSTIPYTDQAFHKYFWN